MKIYNIYEAKTNLSMIMEMVANGEEVVIAKNGKPIADLVPHKPKKRKIKYGFMAGEIEYRDEDLMGIDPDIQEMFFGKDWDK